MITTEQELIELIRDTYVNPIIEKNKFDNLIVRKTKNVECQFYFKYFNKDNCGDSVHESFIGHNCLAMGFQYFNDNWHGGGHMDTCDNQDLSSEIIKLIDTHIKLEKKQYEQLSLF